MTKNHIVLLFVITIIIIFLSPLGNYTQTATKKREPKKRSFHRELLKLNFRIALSNDKKAHGENFREPFVVKKCMVGIEDI